MFQIRRGPISVLIYTQGRGQPAAAVVFYQGQLFLVDAIGRTL